MVRATVPTRVAIVAAASPVIAVTLLGYPLREVAPVLSLAIVHLAAVIAVATYAGRGYDRLHSKLPYKKMLILTARLAQVTFEVVAVRAGGGSDRHPQDASNIRRSVLHHFRASAPRRPPGP